MSSTAQANTQQPESLSLIVNTWNIARLHGSSPEGLPTDLLSKNSAAFVIFDKIYCDESGLQGELKWRGHWLSADIYSWLKKEKLIVPIDTSQHLPSGFWNQLEDEGITQQAIDLMELALRYIDSGGSPKSIDPQLARLNQEIFLSIDFVNTLPYDYQQYHFRGTRVSRKNATRLKSVLTEEKRHRSRHLSRLSKAMVQILPNPKLLPPMSSVEAGRKMKKNVESERVRLYEVIYGRETHDEFMNYRLSKDFKKDDWFIDDMARRELASANLEKLKSLRSNTEDIRRDLQKYVLMVVNGVLKPDDLWREVITQINAFNAAFDDHFGTDDGRLARLAKNPNVGATVALIELMLSLAVAYPGFSPVSLALNAWLVDQHRMGTIRRKEIEPVIRGMYPLGAANAEFLAAFEQD